MSEKRSIGVKIAERNFGVKSWNVGKGFVWRDLNIIKAEARKQGAVEELEKWLIKIDNDIRIMKKTLNKDYSIWIEGEINYAILEKQDIEKRLLELKKEGCVRNEMDKIEALKMLYRIKSVALRNYGASNTNKNKVVNLILNQIEEEEENLK